MFQKWNLMKLFRINSNININLIVETRRAQMEREGHFSDEWINWQHYARVLEAKRERLVRS
jgi:hypothetical protein